jgi:4-hydroxybenzoate polyprenyltransferase
MPSPTDLTRLLRIEQWYKNLVLFLPWALEGLGNPANVHSGRYLAIGFIGFCAMSSLTYLINDWVDRDKDRAHPIKKGRPLASGRVTGKQAIAVGMALALIAGAAAWPLGALYKELLAVYFIATNAYSFGLKNVPVLDVLMIALNFVLRTLGGMIEWPSADGLSTLGLLFGIVLIFTTHKRWNDRTLLKDKAFHHKPVLRFYNKWLCGGMVALGYSVVIARRLLLVRSDELELPETLVLWAWLGLTSVMFIQNPTLSLKPKGLFKNPLWVFIFGLFLLLLFFD